MQIKEKKIESQVQFWSLIGPFFILLTLFMTLLKASPTNMWMACIAIASVPLCWRWKMVGLGFVITALTGVIVYHFNELTHMERFWNVGMAIAISIGSIVSTLSFEEVDSIVHGLEIESKSRLDNLWHLDEKIKVIQTSQESEKQQLNEQLTASAAEVALLRKQIAAKEQSGFAISDKLTFLENEKLMLLEQVHQIRRQVDLLEKENRDQKRSFQTIESQKNELEGQISTLVHEHDRAQSALHTLRQEFQQKEREYRCVEQEILSQRQLVADLQEKLSRYVACEASLNREIEGIESDSILAHFERNLRQAEGRYRQLTTQFQEKSDILNQTRRELFQAQEALAKVERESEEALVEAQMEMEKEIESLLIRFEGEISAMRENHYEEVDELHNLITALSCSGGGNPVSHK